MPTKAPHPCSHISCPNLVHHSAYCPTHAQAASLAYERDRGSPTARGYGYDWQQYTIGYKRVHPYCVRCWKPVQCVDHIIPVQGPNDPRFFDPTNHQSLCNACHGIKTQEDLQKGLLSRQAGFRLA